jgi:hypothetical protein
MAPRCAPSTRGYRLAPLAVDSGEPEWSAYSGALGRKFLRLDQFLKSNSAKAEENVPNPKLFP